MSSVILLPAEHHCSTVMQQTIADVGCSKNYHEAGRDMRLDKRSSWLRGHGAFNIHERVKTVQEASI